MTIQFQSPHYLEYFYQCLAYIQASSIVSITQPHPLTWTKARVWREGIRDTTCWEESLCKAHLIGGARGSLPPTPPQKGVCKVFLSPWEQTT